MANRLQVWQNVFSFIFPLESKTHCTHISWAYRDSGIKAQLAATQPCCTSCGRKKILILKLPQCKVKGEDDQSSCEEAFRRRWKGENSEQLFSAIWEAKDIVEYILLQLTPHKAFCIVLSVTLKWIINTDGMRYNPLKLNTLVSHIKFIKFMERWSRKVLHCTLHVIHCDKPSLFNHLSAHVTLACH